MSFASCLLAGALAMSASGAGVELIGSAEFCGRCHRAIHAAWKSSAHARSMESRLFQDALESAESELGAAVRKTCLSCHSPIAVQTGDLTLQKKVSWEGVTCDYCHSVREVVLTGPNPRAKLEFGLVKSGTLKGASPTAHSAVFSQVHTSSAICAPCHEYRNAQGFAVLSTYSEWKASSYAKAGKQCQSCHMSKVAGDVVDPKIKRSSDNTVNLHLMPGSHSIDQLNSTFKAQLSTAREGGKLKVTVDVANAAAGHYVPTGSPLRKIVLELRADSYDGKHFRQERVYQRTVADQNGAPLEREHLAFVKAAKTTSDTRLAPDEKRTETFYFDIPQGVQTQVKATFWYHYSPTATAETEKRVTFLTISRLAR
ncbi:MAG: multiheme c-type cytochrome [Bryobacterales bacterium]|nr:multiheme c-type cytochrome [Bryobacterales bacterium]